MESLFSESWPPSFYISFFSSITFRYFDLKKMDTTVQIRNAVASDVPSILGLIKELADFEKAANQVEVTENELLKDGFGDAPSFFCLVATHQNRTVGMALFFFKYSTWKGKTLYLDDIIVTNDFRRRGIGQKLFDKVVEFAATHQLRRLEWQVLEWNQPAIDFYKKNKTNFDDEWINCKLTNHDYLAI
jgi:GNAT superfamily N-acetyltransferase